MIEYYTKRPVTIGTIRYDGTFTSAAEIIEWMGMGYIARYPNNALEQDVEFWQIIIPTMEGDVSASPGDWVIKGIKGEFYPCKPDIFEATYEPWEPKLPDEIFASEHLVATINEV